VPEKLPKQTSFALIAILPWNSFASATPADHKRNRPGQVNDRKTQGCRPDIPAVRSFFNAPDHWSVLRQKRDDLQHQREVS
jgi:hypothetical protein